MLLGEEILKKIEGAGKKWVAAGDPFELGLNWVCFHQVSNCIYLRNSFYCIYLRSFDFFGNWVCFA